MMPVFPLPRLLSGPGSLAQLPAEMDLLRIRRPMLLTDAGLVRAGLARQAEQLMPLGTVLHACVPENPCCADADRAAAAFREADCDGLVALGGGSVMDAGKIVVALHQAAGASAHELLGQPGRIGPGVAPLIAIPTTAGTGSESSPASSLHPHPNGRAVGTRSPFLVPRVAICDPRLVDTLPPHLVAATGMDALAHCLEGYLAEPAHPVVDAVALDGLVRAFTHVRAAMSPEAADARAQLMTASFAGGVAIHKGLGPAHAVALACGDQHLHHGLMVAAALPWAAELAATWAPAKADRIADALGLPGREALAPAFRALNASLGLAAHLGQAGYRVRSMDELVDAMAASHFNRCAPHAPAAHEYRAAAEALLL